MSEHAVPSFPVAQAEETVHSVVARHLRRHAGSRTRHLQHLGLLLSSPHAIAPARLDDLAARMPPGHPWRHRPLSIVEDHTLVPIFTSFAGLDDRVAANEAIALGKLTNPTAFFGLSVSDGLNMRTYKFCRHCVVDDWQKGFPVSYREHQPSFVRVCAKHGDPLVRGCTVCFAANNSAARWQLTGDCRCGGAFFEFDLQGCANSELEGWLWLSRQVSWLCRQRPPSHACAASVLKEKLKKAFGYRGGISPKLVHEGLVAAFGSSVLGMLGLDQARDGSTSSSWPSRTFSSKRRPFDLIKLLTLSRLVSEDVSELFQPATQSVVAAPPEAAAGYSRARDERVVRDKETLLSALRLRDYALSAVAAELNVSSYSLAAELAAARIRVPLSVSQVKRLGPERIREAQLRLRAGEQKLSIKRRLALSEWSLLLIELDTPDLADAHRQAVIDEQRNFHRTALSDWLKERQGATRSEIASELVATVDWLRRFDESWLHATWPAKKKAEEVSAAMPRRDWASKDVVARGELQDLLQALGRNDAKPVYLLAPTEI